MPFDESEDEPLTTPDTENATHFNYQEAPSEQREHYERLALYNSGLCNGAWTDQEVRRRLDNLGLYDSITSHLELTPHQKRRGRVLFDDLNVRGIGAGAEAVAFCVAAIVARDDGRVYHPQRANEHNDRLFVDFANDLSLTRGGLQACYNRVSEELE